MRMPVSVRSIGFLTIKYGQRYTPLHAGFCLSQGPTLGYERLLILPENTAKRSGAVTRFNSLKYVGLYFFAGCGHR